MAAFDGHEHSLSETGERFREPPNFNLRYYLRLLPEIQQFPITVGNGKEIEITFKDPNKRILDLDNLLEKLKQATGASARLTPAQFALQMIARIEEVSVSIVTPPPR